MARPCRHGFVSDRQNGLPVWSLERGLGFRASGMQSPPDIKYSYCDIFYIIRYWEYRIWWGLILIRGGLVRT